MLGFVFGAQGDQQTFHEVQYAENGWGLRIYRWHPYPTLTLIGQTDLPDPQIGHWYDLRLEVVGDTFKVYVDGVLQLTALDPYYRPGRAGLLAYQGSRNEYDDITVHSLNYAATGIYTSSVFNAGGHIIARQLIWTGSTPIGTNVGFLVRSAGTLGDLAHAAWVAPDPNGWLSEVKGRFLQYQATLSVSDPTRTPVVQEVSVSYEIAPIYLPLVLKGH